MNVVLLGSGGHAKVIVDIIEQAGEFPIVGVIDAHRAPGESFLGYPILGRDEDLPRITAEYNVRGAVIAIGDNWIRAKIAAAVRSLTPKLEFPNAVHPAASIANRVQLGQGNVLMAGAVINSDTTLGDFGIYNTNCSVDHDGRIGDFVSLAPNSCAGGNVEIGDFCAIGLGANIIHRIRIGMQTVVGAGSTVLKDLPDCVVAYGTPARVVRRREPGERYL